MSTQARAANTAPAPTGRLSRHSPPRASRHQALTPNSSAPPEATRPGRIVICAQSRLPARATTPGPIASTARPRRIGTARQTEPRSVPHQPGQRRAGQPSGRVAARLDAQLVARRTTGGQVRRDGTERDARPRAAPRSTPMRRDPARAEPVDQSGRPASWSGARRGRWPRWPVSWSSTAVADERTRRCARTTAMPCVAAPDRLHRPRDDLADGGGQRRSRASMPTRRATSDRRSTPYDVAPSRIQACSSQAMLSGASSSAPRWSVVGLTG